MGTENKKILFLRFSSIGDIVLIHPVIEQYKKQYPNSVIHFATKDVYIDLVRNSPYIDKTFYLKTSKFYELFHLTKILRTEKYDLLIDLHNSLRSRMLRFLLLFTTKKVKTFKKPYLKRLFLIHFKWNLFSKKTSIIEAYAKAAGLQVQAEHSWDYHLIEKDLNTVTSFLFEHNNKNKKVFHLAIMASARWQTKAWPQSYYIQLINLLKTSDKNIHLYLFGGEGDFKLNENIINSANAKNYCSNMAGKLTINESAALLSKMNLFFTNDTGLMHIAGGVHIPIIAIFGCTVKQFGFFPFQKNAQVLESNQHCRPCTSKGRDLCPQNHFKCMKEISVDEVHKKIQNYIKSFVLR